jgi:dienelactone hydrolase
MSSGVVVAHVEYDVDGQRMRGRIAESPGDDRQRPGVVLFPEWWGVDDYIVERATQLAESGYVVLVADMYGDGCATRDQAEAARQASTTRTGPLARSRARGALEALIQHPRVDPDRLTAAGFCFGGSVALELARDGRPVKGVVAFHAGLATTLPTRGPAIDARVLVLHGADDPFVSADELANFQNEMRAAAADWEVVIYGGAQHSFTRPDASRAQMAGVAYNELAARRSWDRAQAFLRDCVNL